MCVRAAHAEATAYLCRIQLVLFGDESIFFQSHMHYSFLLHLRALAKNHLSHPRMKPLPFASRLKANNSFANAIFLWPHISTVTFLFGRLIRYVSARIEYNCVCSRNESYAGSCTFLCSILAGFLYWLQVQTTMQASSIMAFFAQRLKPISCHRIFTTTRSRPERTGAEESGRNIAHNGINLVAFSHI